MARHAFLHRCAATTSAAQTRLLQVTVAAGETLKVSLTSGAANAAKEVYLVAAYKRGRISFSTDKTPGISRYTPPVP
jgi:hypothetical protein